MIPVRPCRLKITTTLLICILATSSSFTFLALAQESSPFEIELVPQAEYAVAGHPFTYTIAITNINQAPMNDVLVLMEIPAGTTFLETHQNVNWLTGGARPGETGVVVWNMLEPNSPETITFELVINVLPETANQQLVSQEMTLINESNGEVIATGPPVTLQVLAVMPTATPSPTPTYTATNTPTPTATSSPTSTPKPTPTPRTKPTISDSAASTLITTSAGEPATPIVPIIFGLLAVGGSAMGLIWFFKRK